PGYSARFLRQGGDAIQARAEGAEFVAMERKRISQDGRSAGFTRGEGVLHCGTALDARDAGGEWALGRLSGRGSRAGGSVRSVCKAFNAAGREAGTGEDSKARRKACSQTAPEVCDMQVRSIEHGKTMGGSVFASDLSEGNPRTRVRIRQEGGVYPRRRFHSVC